MSYQTTISIPYRQYSILNRFMADIGTAQLARFAALPDAERNKFQDLSPLELHQKGAEICQWILIRHPAVGDDMDDGEEEADWKDVGALDGATIKYAPNAWKDSSTLDVFTAALQVHTELRRRYYPGPGPYDVNSSLE